MNAHTGKRVGFAQGRHTLHGRNPETTRTPPRIPLPLHPYYVLQVLPRRDLPTGLWQQQARRARLLPPKSLKRATLRLSKWPVASPTHMRTSDWDSHRRERFLEFGSSSAVTAGCGLVSRHGHQCASACRTRCSSASKSTGALASTSITRPSPIGSSWRAISSGVMRFSACAGWRVSARRA